MPDIVRIIDATVTWPNGIVALQDVNLTIRDGETWAVVGPIASGKTTLAETLLGKHRLTAGSLEWPLLDRLRAAGRRVAFASDVVKMVAFREESWLFSHGRHYYQQRYNFIEPEDDLSLEEFLRAGNAASPGAIRTTADRLGVGGLLPLSLIKLSNGQLRRARLAKALSQRPELLILDDPFVGLDDAGRADLTELLGGLVAEGQRLLLIARPDAVPGWVTNVLELGDHAGAGSVSDGLLAQACLSEYHGSTVADASGSDDPIVELRDVTVAYGDEPILDNLNWTVNAGERWAVLGPNGSGKTTLLSLLCGDHPQAYCNHVSLFGRRRGTGESIWDVKRNVGLLSPELHLYFTEPLTAEQVAATGFFDVLVRRRTTEEQSAGVRELFGQFGITRLADRPFRQLSTGEQRLVLLVRALVKQPRLLILDEPFQSLDDAAIRTARDWLDRELRPEQTLLFVTHLRDEIPRSVTRTLQLAIPS